MSASGSDRPGSPAPCDGPRLMDDLMWLTSFRIVMLLAGSLAITCALSVTRTLVSPYYCDNGAISMVDCAPCPNNTICANGRRRCVDGATDTHGACIADGTVDDWALKNLEHVESVISSQGIRTVKELVNLRQFSGITSRELKQAIAFSSKFGLDEDVISVQFDPRVTRAIVLLVGAFAAAAVLLPLMRRGKR